VIVEDEVVDELFYLVRVMFVVVDYEFLFSVVEEFICFRFCEDVCEECVDFGVCWLWNTKDDLYDFFDVVMFG